MPAIVVRVIIFVYEEQYAWVRWGKSRSSIVNGTRQGSILSPALFALYVDELLVELRKQGIGCKVAGVFMGAVGFCDDLLLLAPTRDGMQVMLDTCQRFTSRYNLMFSTDPNPAKSKTKCIFVCGQAKKAKKPSPLVLNGKDLPWVESAVHLGHLLHESGTMDRDVLSKRAGFIRESTEIRETFDFASPVEVLKAVKLYAGSHYGSNLWKLDGDTAGQYYSAWRTCVKLAWQAHTYFVDHLLSCDYTSVRMDILSRFVKFVKGLKASPSVEVAVMCGIVEKDIRSVTGSNLEYLRWETGMDPLGNALAKVKEALGRKKATIPEDEKWRVGYLGKLLQARGEALYEGGQTGLMTTLIDCLCVN